MIRTIIESPFAGDRVRHRRYLIACVRDSFKRGEAPYASHLIGPFALNDHVPEERERGMAAGYAWMERADRVAIYLDCGFSPGMAEGLRRAAQLQLPVERRWLGFDWERRQPPLAMPVSLPPRALEALIGLTAELRIDEESAAPLDYRT